MYSYIKGELIEISEESIVVENNGIGYNIRIPASILNSSMIVGTTVKIYTYTYVREDAMHLYGFLDQDGIGIFKLLLGVSGIGPKGALGILSALTPDNLRFAIVGDDIKTITKAPGIGKKTAQRLIIELKDKINIEDTFQNSSVTQGGSIETQVVSGIREEAVLALAALGYSSGEAIKAIQGIEIVKDTTVEEVLKSALKQMATI